MNAVFDKSITQRNKTFALNNLPKADFLFAHSRHNLSERLKDINRQFKNGVLLGGRDAKNLSQDLINTGKVKDLTIADDIKSGDLLCDLEALPFADQSLDLIVANMTLHHINDLPGTLIQIRRALKSDGLFLGALMGGESLYTLREILTEVDLVLTGGAVPRIHPFADKQQMGALMQRAGFALPVIDSDIIEVSYKSLINLHQDLKNMGEGIAINARKTPALTRPVLQTIDKRLKEIAPDKYDTQRFTIQFEQIYLCGWSPHESQQKPLQPGSAKNRLADALNTTESEI